MYTLPARSVRALSRQWVNRLAHYRLHRSDEHREALVLEALKFSGLALENDLSGSTYWADAPLARRVALLLFLVDRGAVDRVIRDGRATFLATEQAEDWVLAQPALIPYITPTLEMIEALRAIEARHTPTRD